MKKLLLFTFSMFFVLSFAQKKNNIDSRLVGSWKGSEKGNQMEEIDKYWIQERYKDGTFILLFIAIQKNGEVMQSTEKGKWWTEGNTFYELHYVSGLTDIYTYEVLDDSHVKFKAKDLEIDMDNPNYEFIDTKIDD